MKRIAILASGSGSNAEAIIHYLRQSREAEVVLLLTNRPDAGVRERARRLGVRCDYLPTAELREGSKPLALLAELGVELVVLAGYLVLITEPWLQAYPQRILNIHPALLPESTRPCWLRDAPTVGSPSTSWTSTTTTDRRSCRLSALCYLGIAPRRWRHASTSWSTATTLQR